MRIFDNVLLAQYLDVGAKVRVFANGKWYDLADKSDVSDPIDAIGYDEYGGDHRFSYQTIEQIEVNNQIITLDMLSQKMGDKPDGGDDKKSKPKDDSGSGDIDGDLGDEDLPDDEPKGKKPKEPDLSWFSPMYDIGRHLMSEKERKMKSGNKV